MQNYRKPVLVVNAHSRQGSDNFELAKQLLTEHKVELYQSYMVKNPEKMRSIVKGALSQGSNLIIVGGGDGTISTIVDDLAYKNVTLGILPMGTANSFARTLDIPLTIQDAVHTIVHGRVTKLDLGKINDDYFANTASLGLTTKVAHTIKPWIKRYFGKAGYYIYGFIKFLTHKPFDCTIRYGNMQNKFKALEIFIANGRYHGGVMVAEDAHLRSHDIHIRVITGTSIWNLFKSGFGILTGTIKDMNFIKDIKITEAELDTSPRYNVSIDGEVVTQTPIKISVAPQALNVMVP
jgi:YegS/Rv2252/BmrU family lipid kinase